MSLDQGTCTDPSIQKKGAQDMGIENYQPMVIEGQAFERGRQYGELAKEAIHQNIRAYLDLIEFHSGLARDTILEAANQFGPPVQTHAPDLFLEMRGIADGAACDLTEILLINARSELMSMTDECTSVAATSGGTRREMVLLAQNWDWYTSVEPEPILLQIRQPDRPEILTLAEAGQVGKIGMNSAGLGVSLDFLEHFDRGQGVPVHVILRQMLGCSALGEAIRAALSVPRAGAANILIGHAAGEILDLELTATDADFIYGDGGWLVHTNHFESPRLREGDRGIRTSMSTLARAARARRLVAAQRGGISLDTTRAVLTDHAYGSYAICRHPDPTEPPLQQTATRASAIMDLTARKLYLALGQPCDSEFLPFSLC
jgi:isopenicillin-N N-acyltransferase-like protein